LYKNKSGGAKMYKKVNKVKVALQENRTAIGTWVQMATPEIVEVVGYQGYDFVIIDMEHGQFGFESVPNMIRAAEATDVTPIIRVPQNEESIILKVLDAGAMGVLVPGVMTKEQAEKAVKAAKYGPEFGIRGACPWTRATQYNVKDWVEHVQWSNEETMAWLLIEGKQGVENFDEILSVPYIDALVMGPFDLSQSLGIPGQLDHPLLLETLKTMVEKASEKGIQMVAVMLSEFESNQIQASIQKWRDLGCKIMTVGGDRALLSVGFGNFLATAKSALN
jgi:4-hydroxy-2-oxoheptanedioate aldolase